ncbi:MAG: glycosyltransferase, partial [Candidatus Thermoplasmatota archaeon]
MRICFVTHRDVFTYKSLPSPYLRAIKEIKTLLKNGHEIVVISWIRYEDKLSKYELRDGIKIHRIYKISLKKNFIKRVHFFLKLTKETADKIKELSPDCIVCHDLELLSACVKANKKLKIPLFYDSHDDIPALIYQNNKLEGKIAHLLERKLIRQVEHIFVPSEPLADKFRKHGATVTVLYNVRELNQCFKDEKVCEELRRNLGFSKNDFIVGYAGILEQRRCLKELIKALTVLPAKIKLVIVGNFDTPIAEYESYAELCKVRDRVRLT